MEESENKMNVNRAPLECKVSRPLLAAVARNLNAPKRDVSTLPGCGVGGMVRPGALCGSVIVGGKLCGHDGECQHKVHNAKVRGCPITKLEQGE